MAKFLFVWEMGANFGHIGALLPPALALRERGHRVVFCLQRADHALMIKETHGFQTMLSPFLKPLAQSGQPLLSYADILYQIGFGDRDGLFHTVQQWRRILNDEQPDVLVLNSAPTASLAAQGMGLKTVLYGHGFDLPPQTTPMPAARNWIKISPGQLLAIENRVLTVINHVRARLNHAHFSQFTDLMHATERMLMTVKELDHYPLRTNEKYWGWQAQTTAGLPIKWQGKKKYRVFAYLRANAVSMELVAAHMQDLHCEYIVMAPDITTRDCLRYSVGSLRVVNQPVSLDEVITDCSLAICHGGLGTTQSFLLHGIPLIVLPTQLEQFLIARNVATHGFGTMLNLQDTKLELDKTIKQVLREPRYRIKAKEFSKKYHDRSQNTWLNAVVTHLSEIAKKN